MWNWLTFIILIHDGLIAKPRSGLSWTSDQFTTWCFKTFVKNLNRDTTEFPFSHYPSWINRFFKCWAISRKGNAENKSIDKCDDDEHRLSGSISKCQCCSNEFAISARREHAKENIRMFIILDFSACSARRARFYLYRQILRLFPTPAGAFNFFWSSCFL